MALAGLSTLGVTLGYGTGSSKPATFTQLTRINSIGGISLDTNQIDASALEDAITKYIAGRMDTGGTWEIVVNLTPDTITEIKTMISAYKALTGGSQMWMEVCGSQLSDAFFAIVQPPTEIPMPEMNQNELMTVTLTFTIVEYKGLDTKVSF